MSQSDDDDPRPRQESARADAEKPDRPADPDRGLSPAAILSGWWNAARTIAEIFLRPPLLLLGAAPAKPDDTAIARAARGFPVVGLGLGVAAGLVLLAARGVGLPMAVAAVLAVGLLAYGGGGLFEAGFARFMQGVIPGGTKRTVLAAMRSRTPGYVGILLLVFAFAVKVTALASLPGPAAASAAIIAAVTASWGVVPALLYYLPAAQTKGLAARAGTPRFDEVALSAAFGGAVALLFLGPWAGVIALAVGAGGALKMAWLARRSAGGVTGAALGAAQQGVEIGVLLAVAAIA
ncbi:MAG: adenosylcobinamide-GDP ribazoletransferase [Alphaproteobacteria bacterium]